MKPREIINLGDIALIPLTQGQVAIIDSVDIPLVENHNWYAHKPKHVYYAHRYIKINGKDTVLKMHRLISGANEDEVVDHINGIGIDNRRKNLRKCSQHQNIFNSSPHHDTSSKYRGVSWNKINNKWKAQIQFKEKKYSLGHWDTEEEAALAYNTKARELFGEYAFQNVL